jgi:hypothetical protein
MVGDSYATNGQPAKEFAARQEAALIVDGKANVKSPDCAQRPFQAVDSLYPWIRH